ncbi:SIS domain-containing protein [Novosphingobium sp. FKTRR1]|uniref:KpsF/GutQ family sugar-phosphate isomerase n=1 Tax=unclassified Novosphingobium TaxID=2644732 RepID=UPI001CF002A3|nr:KpsF/GutQ family sugar-phosphate isomerase [Novosphingobium sp. FKTRR1]
MIDRLAHDADLAVQPVLERGRAVIRAEAAALGLLEQSLNAHFVDACHAIARLRRQLVITGMGKSGHIARKLAATFAATGTPAIHVHPGEAAHGDLGMLVEGDVLLALSNSGNTAELRAVLEYTRKRGIPIIGMAAQRESHLIRYADIPLILPQVPEACATSGAPTTSTTMQLALGDALAMTVMDLRGVSRQRLQALHPAGSIGLALTPLAEVMHAAERLPLVPIDADMCEAVAVMTRGCFGLVGVTDPGGGLVGVITDGDLRRHFAVLQSARAGEVMTRMPKVLPADMTAGEALMFLNDNQITAAFVMVEPNDGAAGRPAGIIHIHDLLRFGLA